MKTKTTAIILIVFLLSMLNMTFVTLADNPSISDVGRFKDVCWFHLMTGYSPNGVSVGSGYGEPTHYYEEGYFALTYRNLSPDWQQIRLKISPGANYVFHLWPERWAYDITEWALREEILDGGTRITWVIWGVPTEEVHLMQDLWFMGWSAGQQIEVTLELLEPYREVLYQHTLTIMPLGPRQQGLKTQLPLFSLFNKLLRLNHNCLH